MLRVTTVKQAQKNTQYYKERQARYDLGRYETCFCWNTYKIKITNWKSYYKLTTTLLFLPAKSPVAFAPHHTPKTPLKLNSSTNITLPPKIKYRENLTKK
jgi:hypothetical protein